MKKLHLTPPRRPSSQEHDEIVRLREERKLTVGQIAYRTGFTKSTVMYHLLRAGLDPFDGQNLGGMHRFSPQEDARLLDLARQGKKKDEISRLMKRPPTSVFMRLMLLEARAEKALEVAA